MADDVTLNSMSGGPVVATDDSGTGHVQIVKLAYSADGSRTHVDADADGLEVKVSNASIPVTDNGGSLTVDGTVAATQSGTWTVKQTHKPTPYKLNSAASTNATSVAAVSDTLLYGYYISNTNAAVRYVKFYNKASAPTVGTDTPVLVLAIPGSGAANASFPAGINFTTGLAFATTTGAADADTAAVAANEIIVNLVYATY